MMTLHPGMLRARIVLQRPERTADGAGGFTVAWEDFSDAWAEVTPLSGRERLVAEKLESQVSHRMRLRYIAGVTADMRVLLGNRSFAIHAVINVDERGEFLELLTMEGGAV